MESGTSAGLENWLSYIESIHFRTIDLSLDRPRRVLHLLELKTPKVVITVGGTNGKGTTVSMVEAAYRSAGYKVGCYTSPHLISYCERIRLSGLDVNPELLCEAFSAVDNARGNIPLTYFEFGTLAAFYVFSHLKIDVAILEVGMGGRLDAVNLLNPDLAILCTIDIDHQAWLGSTREKIGAEKAGIFRYRGKVVIADPDPPSSVISRLAILRCEAQQHHKNFEVRPSGQNVWVWRHFGDATFGVGLPEEVQIASGSLIRARNLSGALASVYALQDRLPIKVKDLDALLAAVTPGRRQHVEGEVSLWLDVGHNIQAIEGLASELARESVNGKTRGVFAMLGDKDIEQCIGLIDDQIDEWFLAELNEPRAISIQELKGKFSALKVAETAGQKNAAMVFRQALEASQPGDRIVAFGSFYLVGDILAAHAKRIFS